MVRSLAGSTCSKQVCYVEKHRKRGSSTYSILLSMLWCGTCAFCCGNNLPGSPLGVKLQALFSYTRAFNTKPLRTKLLWTLSAPGFRHLFVSISVFVKLCMVIFCTHHYHFLSASTTPFFPVKPCSLWDLIPSRPHESQTQLGAQPFATARHPKPISILKCLLVPLQHIQCPWEHHRVDKFYTYSEMYDITTT